MKVMCVECGREVPADKINVQELIAVCPHCNSVFAFEAPAPVLAKTKLRKVKQPEFVTVAQTPDEWRLSIRWHLSTEPKWLVALMSFWLTGCLLIALSGFVTGDGGRVLAALATGFVPANFFAVLALNTFTMSVKGTRLTVHHGPIPWFGTYNTSADLTGVRRIETRISEYSADTGEPTSNFYDVVLDYGNGQTKVIVPFITQAQAQYVEQELTRYLHEGELPAIERLVLDEESDELAEAAPRLEEAHAAQQVR
jgi:hypothetical protein